MQGLVEKMELNLWDGFHEFLIDMGSKLIKRETETYSETSIA